MSILENKIKTLIQCKGFLQISCAVIFLLSIFFRSKTDIGSDTGVYLSLGSKIAHGGKYYFDFLESNFPLSFYIYALEYHFSNWLGINPIAISEIFINLLGLLSIFWSAKILQRTTIYDNKAHYNLIIISYFLGFFLRSYALEIGEFGSKTSFLLILFYPFISYSFERKTEFKKSDLIYRGCLMGLIPCFKPHYLILVLFIECRNFFKTKSLKFFFELDKLVMCFIGATYIVLMMKFTPEFFEFVVPMWLKIYGAYDNAGVFWTNLLRLSSSVMVSAFIFLIFTRLKFSNNDKILALFFAAAGTLMMLENIATIDQVVIFSSIATICFSKFLFDLFFAKEFSFANNKFIIGSLFFIPLFEITILPDILLGLGGTIAYWWAIALIYPFIFVKNIKLKKPKEWTSFKARYLSKKKIIFALIIYFLALATAIIILKNFSSWALLTFNLVLLFTTLFFFEKKIYAKFFPHFSPFFVFVVITSASCLFYSYVRPIVNVNINSTPSKLTDSMAYYAKVFAPQHEDKMITFSAWIAHQFPLINYLGKQDDRRISVFSMQAGAGAGNSFLMFPTTDLDKVFTATYLLDDIKAQLRNPKTKLVFMNNSANIMNRGDRCLIGYLEYYLLDHEFRKIFLKNFHFENHVIIIDEIKPIAKPRFISIKKSDIFDKLTPSTKKVSYDLEVYVRN